MQNNNGTVQKAWLRFEEASQVYDVSVKQGKRPDRRELERVFKEAELVLRAYCGPNNFTLDKAPEEHFPKRLAHLIANQIAYIRQGKLPDPIKDMLRPGSPGIGPIERTDIRTAVAYVLAVKAKLIEDKRPVTNVCKYYGVKPKTVYNWRKKYSSVKPSDLYENLDGLGQDESPIEIVKKASFRYKRGGRSSVGRADHRRPNKRPKKRKSVITP